MPHQKLVVQFIGFENIAYILDILVLNLFYQCSVTRPIYTGIYTNRNTRTYIIIFLYNKIYDFIEEVQLLLDVHPVF